MTFRVAAALVCLAPFTVAACSDSGEGTPPGSAGAGATAGTNSNAGSANGGSASGSGGASAGSGGSVGGTAEGGAAGSAVTGGAGAGGSAGGGGTAGAGGMPAGPVKPVMRNGKWAFDFGDVTLEVDPMVGGRITTFKSGATNLLVSQADTKNQYYWGSTMWVSPEATKWMQPPPAELDRDPYTVTSDDTSLTMTSAPYAKLGVTATKVFSVDTKLGAFTIEYRLNNTAQAPVQMAAWEVTRVFPRGLTFFPKGPTEPILSQNATLPTTEMAGIIWFNYDMNTVTANSKMYADGAEGWVAHVDGDLVFIKSFPDLPAAKIAPKEGDVELFANIESAMSARYIEIEEQGEYAMIAPGASTSLKVNWFLRKLPATAQATPGNAALAQFVRDTIAGK